MSLAAHVRAVHDGKKSFDQMVKDSKHEWSYLARFIFRRWDVPASFDENDLVQEMLMSVWDRLQSYQDGKASLERYVIWNAIKRAERHVHNQRASLRRNGKAKTRTAIPFAFMSETHENFLINSIGTECMSDRLIFRDAKRVLPQAIVDLFELFESSGFNEDLAGAKLWRTPDWCLSLKLDSEVMAVRAVKDAADIVAMTIEGS